VITKREAKEYVYNKVILSLRQYAKRLTTGQISGKATQKDVAKVRAEMEALAAKLEKKLNPGRIIDVPKPTQEKDDDSQPS